MARVQPTHLPTVGGGERNTAEAAGGSTGTLKLSERVILEEIHCIRARLRSAQPV